jgi:protein O-GlcNAc transferase
MPDEIAIDQLLDAALARHQAGQLDLAEAGYRAVLQRDPREPDALNLLSVILQDRGDLDGSIALASRALDIVPDFPEALINLARAHRAAGAPGPAADAARRAVALDADQAEAHLQLGCALLDLHDDTEASEALTAALTLDPDRVDVQGMLARALASLARVGCEAGDSKSAIVRLRRLRNWHQTGRRRGSPWGGR